MIIWLASYPKSGNTWLRFFILSLFFGDKGEVNLDHIKNIEQFPSKSQFENLGIDLKITQINIPKLDLSLTLDHSKQQLYHGFSTQLINKKAVKKDQNRLKAHYYEVLIEAIVKFDTSKAHKNMELISENFYSVINKLK